MKVVWLTPYLPTPTGGGGSVHEFELLRGASAEHDIHLICSELPPGRRSFDLDGRAISAEGVAFTSRFRRSHKLVVALNLALSWPYTDAWMHADRVRALSEALRAQLRRDRADLVHLTFGETAPLARVASVPTTLLLFDVASRQLRREAELAARRRAAAAYLLEAGKVVAWERRWFARAQALACVSPVDGDVLRRMLRRDVAVIPNPVPDAFYSAPAAERSRDTVVMVANLGYRANTEAVEWLAREIWPRVRAAVPDARLQVVGAKPRPEVLAAVTEAGGELHADVADVRPFYWGAAVAVAPIRLGSGLRNKVLHAIACGAPVVATSTSLEGIPARDRDHLLVADDAPAFSEAIVSVLRDPQEAAERADRARPLVEPYRRERVVEQLLGWWAAAVA